MKTLILCLNVVLLLSVPAVAQVDISLIDISVSSDTMNTVPAGINSTAQISVMNAGTISLSVGDTIGLSLLVGSKSITSELVLSANLDSGEVAHFNLGIENRIPFNSGVDTIIANGSLSLDGDINLSNNQLQETFYISSTVNNDWQAVGVNIISPLNLDNFDIDNGTNIPPPLNEVGVDLKNNGSVTYLEGTLLEYTVYINGDVRHVESSVKTDILPGGTSNRVISNQAVLPAIPTGQAAPFELCAASNTPSDQNSANDAYCLTFTIIDNYDPTDPVNWPQGLDEHELENSISVSDRQLNLHVNGTCALQLFDLSGKMVESTRVNSNTIFDLGYLKPGIYFVRLESDGIELKSQKIILL